MRAGQRVHAQLREQILDGVLPPGRVLGEVELSERFGLSRTPVREGLRQLAAEGLAERQGGRGLVVSQISTEDIRPLFEVREALEIQAARLAAARGDREAFRELSERLEHAAVALQAPSQASSSDARPHAGTQDYYRLVEAMDALIDRAADNPWLTAALATLRTQLARVRRLAAHDPSRLTAAAREHAQIARAIASGDPLLAESAVRLHLASALDSALVKSGAAPGDPP